MPNPPIGPMFFGEGANEALASQRELGEAILSALAHGIRETAFRIQLALQLGAAVYQGVIQARPEFEGSERPLGAYLQPSLDKHLSLLTLQIFDDSDSHEKIETFTNAVVDSCVAECLSMLEGITPEALHLWYITLMSELGEDFEL